MSTYINRKRLTIIYLLILVSINCCMFPYMFFKHREVNQTVEHNVLEARMTRSLYIANIVSLFYITKFILVFYVRRAVVPTHMRFLRRTICLAGSSQAILSLPSIIVDL